MTVSKLPLKKVTYLRSHDDNKQHNIILGGDSRWLRDIELLLEDQWKNVFCPEDFTAFKNTISENSPRIVVVELNAFSGNDSRLIDLIQDKYVEKLLVTHSVTDLIGWQRAQRIFSGKSVKCVELSASPKIAADELSELMSNLCIASISSSEDLQFIQHAYLGYGISGINSLEESFLNLFKFIAAKFVFEPNDIVAGTILAETYTLWKKPKAATSELAFAYLNIENSIKDENVLKLIELSRTCLSSYKAGDFSENSYSNIILEVGFGRLTQRMLKVTYTEIHEFLSKKSTGLRLLKIA